MVITNLGRFDISVDKGAEGAGPVCDFNRELNLEKSSGPIDRTRIEKLSMFGPLFFDLLYNGLASGRSFLKKALDKVKTASDVDFFLEGQGRG